MVSGRLQIRSWTDKDGNKRRSAEIVADNVYFGDSKKDSGDTYTSGGDYSSGYPETQALINGYSAQVPASDFAMLDDDDAQLPF